jgi:ribonuclease BN (tRNA processing enzyme)
LPDVLSMAAEIGIRKLILGHFSTRYSHEQIMEAVEAERTLVGYPGAVELTLPGAIAHHQAEV